MMSVERSFEAWEEVQRHGQDLADRLAQGFTGLIQSHISPPAFPWPSTHNHKVFDVEFPSQNFVKRDFGISVDSSGINGVTAILDIGSRLGQAGVDFGACVNGMVQQFFRSLPVPFRQEDNMGVSLRTDLNRNIQISDLDCSNQENLRPLDERSVDCGFIEIDALTDESLDQEIPGVSLTSTGCLGRSQGSFNVTSTFDSRTRDIESSLVARGDLWRVEASHGSSTSGSENSLFLVQLGPVLFVRDSTLLLPVHLSKQHLLWYGYDRRNGIHSLCPAVWSKHRRWLLMSMFCLNPLACSFMDVQFPNGQVTYVSGEGLSTSAFVPICGGLLQAQGKYPGDMKFSFSCMNKWGTRITPTVKWPDKSFTLGLAQALAWKRSGLMVKPTVQISICPTIGGSNPGLHAELTHYLKEELSLNWGCALVTHPSAFASVSLGRSKWNGNVGRSGVVVRVETPLDNVSIPSFSIQLNSGIEF